MRVKLTNKAQKLFDKLVLDTLSQLPESDQIYKPKYNQVLIYNLFKGKYQYSFSLFEEIYKYLDYRKFKSQI